MGSRAPAWWVSRPNSVFSRKPRFGLLGAVQLPYTISTLIYGFDRHDAVLLLQRSREPNAGLWSPFGGKLKTELGESPFACACRETWEEIGLRIGPEDLHLTGLVSEHGYQGAGHWLMFLFELKPRLAVLPPPHVEGEFRFFSRAELANLELPRSDREQIWPLFWEHRGGFFSAHCHCHAGGRDVWIVEQSNPVRLGAVPGRAAGETVA